MLSSLSFFIGSRFSRARQRNKLVSFISISSTIGITVGVAVIIIGLSAMNGFEQELRNRVLSVVAHGEFEAVDGHLNNWQEVMQVAEQDKSVVAAAPYVKFTALAESGARLKAISVRGIEPQYELQVSSLHRFISGVNWTEFIPGQGQMILGKGVADSLGLVVGDSLTLLIPANSDSVNKVQAPRRVRVKISALLSLGGQLDHGLALLPLQDAQSYARLGEAVSGVSIRTSDVLNAPMIVRSMGNRIPAYVYLRSWKQQYGFLYRDIQMVRTIMYLVMVLVIGVACFNIVSTLMMAVKDRAAEIAILRTMGATDGLIRRIFIWLGVLSGVLGSIVGSLVGILVALNLTSLIKGLERLLGHQFLSGDIYFIDFLPSEVRGYDVLVVSGTAIVLSLFATWYPAQKAARMNPAAVLSGK